MLQASPILWQRRANGGCKAGRRLFGHPLALGRVTGLNACNASNSNQSGEQQGRHTSNETGKEQPCWRSTPSSVCDALP